MNLRQLREACDLSQIRAAKLLSDILGRSIAQQSVARWETGKINPGADIIKAMAQAYEVSADVVIDAIMASRDAYEAKA